MFSFAGKELYLFNSQYLLPGYPKPLTKLGLPSSLDKLDAAMVWGHNGKTYFYSGTMYWKWVILITTLLYRVAYYVYTIHLSKLSFYAILLSIKT